MGLLEFAAKRFVAGKDIVSAVKGIKKLNKLNILATVDFLGENVSNKSEASEAANEYLVILDEIEKHNLKCNVSLKLTMMGLEIDQDFCFENVLRIVKKAARLDNFVRIDMEGSPVTKATLDVFERLYKDHKNVGIVLQAALFRSLDDARKYSEMGVNIRLCKGAYKEADTIAYSSKIDVNKNYLRICRLLLEGRGKVAIATHDQKMIDPIAAYIKENNIESQRYEWQMLYGIERNTQKNFAKNREAVRVYVPYGNDWLGYFSRRMMERKENFFFALKHFLRG